MIRRGILTLETYQGLFGIQKAHTIHYPRMATVPNHNAFSEPHFEPSRLCSRAVKQTVMLYRSGVRSSFSLRQPRVWCPRMNSLIYTPKQTIQNETEIKMGHRKDASSPKLRHLASLSDSLPAGETPVRPITGTRMPLMNPQTPPSRRKKHVMQPLCHCPVSRNFHQMKTTSSAAKPEDGENNRSPNKKNRRVHPTLCYAVDS